MKQFFLMYLAILLLLLAGCREDGSEGQITASDSIAQIDTPIVVKTDNAFSRVLDSLCGGTGDFSELIYTNANTDFYPIDSIDSLKAFVVSSEVMCGGASGSCGRAISLIQRTAGRYNTVIESCGRVDSVVNLKDKTLIYITTQDYYQRLWTYNGRAVRRSVARIYEWPYLHLAAIAENSNVALENLIPQGTTTDNADAVSVALQQHEVESGATAYIYQLMDGAINKSFVFVNRNNMQKLVLTYNGKLKLISQPNGCLLRDEEQKKAWRYNAKTHTFIATTF